MQEEWRPVVGYEGLYEVSNFGDVKVLPREWECGNKKSKRRHNGFMLKKNVDKNGYYLISLSKNGYGRSFFVHKLIAIAFLNHIPSGHKLVVDHIDGIKTNNLLSNLQIITQDENMKKWSKQRKDKINGK